MSLVSIFKNQTDSTEAVRLSCLVPKLNKRTRRRADGGDLSKNLRNTNEELMEAGKEFDLFFSQ